MSTDDDRGSETARRAAEPPADWRLLGLLAEVERSRLLGLIAVLLLRSLAPVGATLATMAVVSHLAVPGGATFGGLWLSFIALAGSLLVAQITTMLTEPLQFAVRREVDGRHRREVGATALAGGLARLENPAFRDDLLLAAADPANWTERSPGAAAVAQLLRLTKWLGALAAACVVACYDVAAALGLLAVLTLQNMLMRRQWHRMTRVWAGGAAHLRRAAYWTDVTTGAPSSKELRLFGFADWVLARYGECIGRHLVPFRAAKLSLVRRQWIPFAGISLAMAWALWTLADAAVQGRLDAAALSGASVAAWSLFSIGATGAEILDVEGGKIPYAGLLRLREATRAAHAVAQTSATARVPHPSPGRRPPVIRFESVGFHYPGLDRMVLDGLDLTLHPGETLAVVGLNGTGKSTLIKLLAGLYEPTAGRITADGVDLRDLGPGDWYRQVSVVFQDFIHYGLSLRENIALGMSDQPLSPDRHEAAFTRAATDMGMSEIAATLTQGWDTVLQASSAGGSDLSGGQWQRVALARALSAVYAGVRVLVLDEPTAHLDVRTEMEIFDEILDLTADVSTVIVSHRLSTVRKADRIVLLDHGRVTECGTHAELMARQGGYHALFRMQADRFSDAMPGLSVAESAR